MDRLLEVIFDNNDEETVTKQELKSSIFTDDSKINLKEKLQGIVAKHGDDIFEYEQKYGSVIRGMLKARNAGK